MIFVSNTETKIKNGEMELNKADNGTKFITIKNK